MGITAIGALVIGAGAAVVGNPYSAKNVKGSVGINSPLAPKAPPVMPDQSTLLQEGTLQESKDAAVRYGRAATVLTNPGGAGGVSGGSDKLGP